MKKPRGIAKLKQPKPFETAESIRIMKAALEKSGGKTYQNALELQKAQERHKNYMKESLIVVVDNSKKDVDKPSESL